MVVGEGDYATIAMVSLATQAVASVEYFDTDPPARSGADRPRRRSRRPHARDRYELGDLAPGASVTFDVHYVVGETLDDVLVAAADLGLLIPA